MIGLPDHFHVTTSTTSQCKVANYRERNGLSPLFSRKSRVPENANVFRDSDALGINGRVKTPKIRHYSLTHPSPRKELALSPEESFNVACSPEKRPSISQEPIKSTIRLPDRFFPEKKHPPPSQESTKSAIKRSDRVSKKDTPPTRNVFRRSLTDSPENLYGRIGADLLDKSFTKRSENINSRRASSADVENSTCKSMNSATTLFSSTSSLMDAVARSQRDLFKLISTVNELKVAKPAVTNNQLGDTGSSSCSNLSMNRPASSASTLCKSSNVHKSRASSCESTGHAQFSDSTGHAQFYDMNTKPSSSSNSARTPRKRARSSTPLSPKRGSWIEVPKPKLLQNETNADSAPPSTPLSPQRQKRVSYYRVSKPTFEPSSSNQHSVPPEETITNSICSHKSVPLKDMEVKLASCISNFPPKSSDQSSMGGGERAAIRQDIPLMKDFHISFTDFNQFSPQSKWRRFMTPQKIGSSKKEPVCGKKRVRRHSMDGVALKSLKLQIEKEKCAGNGGNICSDCEVRVQNCASSLIGILPAAARSHSHDPAVNKKLVKVLTFDGEKDKQCALLNPQDSSGLCESITRLGSNVSNLENPIIGLPRSALFSAASRVTNEESARSHVTNCVTNEESGSHVTDHVTNEEPAKSHVTDHVTNEEPAKSHVTDHVTNEESGGDNSALADLVFVKGTKVVSCCSVDSKGTEEQAWEDNPVTDSEHLPDGNELVTKLEQLGSSWHSSKLNTEIEQPLDVKPLSRSDLKLDSGSMPDNPKSESRSAMNSKSDVLKSDSRSDSKSSDSIPKSDDLKSDSRSDSKSSDSISKSDDLKSNSRSDSKSSDSIPKSDDLKSDSRSDSKSSDSISKSDDRLDLEGLACAAVNNPSVSSCEDLHHRDDVFSEVQTANENAEGESTTFSSLPQNSKVVGVTVSPTNGVKISDQDASPMNESEEVTTAEDVSPTNESTTTDQYISPTRDVRTADQDVSPTNEFDDVITADQVERGDFDSTPSSCSVPQDKTDTEVVDMVLSPNSCYSEVEEEEERAEIGDQNRIIGKFDTSPSVTNHSDTTPMKAVVMDTPLIKKEAVEQIHDQKCIYTDEEENLCEKLKSPSVGSSTFGEELKHMLDCHFPTRVEACKPAFLAAGVDEDLAPVDTKTSCHMTHLGDASPAGPEVVADSNVAYSTSSTPQKRIQSASNQSGSKNSSAKILSGSDAICSASSTHKLSGNDSLSLDDQSRLDNSSAFVQQFHSQSDSQTSSNIDGDTILKEPNLDIEMDEEKGCGISDYNSSCPDRLENDKDLKLSSEVNVSLHREDDKAEEDGVFHNVKVKTVGRPKKKNIVKSCSVEEIQNIGDSSTEGQGCGGQGKALETKSKLTKPKKKRLTHVPSKNYPIRSRRTSFTLPEDLELLESNRTPSACTSDDERPPNTKKQQYMTSSRSSLLSEGSYTDQDISLALEKLYGKER